MLAKDIMTQKVLTLKPGDSIARAIDVLIDNKISGAPVLDEKGKLIGVVTEKDLLVSTDFIGTKNTDKILVDELMSKDVITYTEDTPVDQIREELVRKNIKRVPIVRGTEVVGIVSRRDILRCMRNDHKAQNPSGG